MFFSAWTWGRALICIYAERWPFPPLCGPDRRGHGRGSGPGLSVQFCRGGGWFSPVTNRHALPASVCAFSSSPQPSNHLKKEWRGSGIIITLRLQIRETATGMFLLSELQNQGQCCRNPHPAALKVAEQSGESKSQECACIRTNDGKAQFTQNGGLFFPSFPQRQCWYLKEPIDLYLCPHCIGGMF